MYEMVNVARLIRIHGGLEALAGRPFEVEIPADGPTKPGGPLFVEHLGAGIVEPRHQMISVAFMVATGNGDDLVAFPEFHFELNPGRDKRYGWESGSWLLISSWNGKALRQDRLTYRHQGHVCIAKQRVREHRDFLRWMDGFVTADVIAGFEREVGDAAARRRDERLDRARLTAIGAGSGRRLKRA